MKKILSVLLVLTLLLGTMVSNAATIEEPEVQPSSIVCPIWGQSHNYYMIYKQTTDSDMPLGSCYNKSHFYGTSGWCKMYGDIVNTRYKCSCGDINLTWYTATYVRYHKNNIGDTLL